MGEKCMLNIDKAVLYGATNIPENIIKQHTYTESGIMEVQ